jgi:dihydroxy-acid dehydratase
MLVPLDELAERSRKLVAQGGYGIPESQTPWQALFREKVGRFDQGMTLDGATEYQDVARKHMPRDNH